VGVRALGFIENATDVEVEPLTPADWLLLQSNAAWLENGGILGQVSVVYPNQILPLWIQNDLVRVRVVPESFCRTNIWCEEDLPCMRLVADTKFLVQPKEEEKQAVASLRIYPSEQEYASPMSDIALQLKVPLPHVHQFSAIVHPAHMLESGCLATVKTDAHAGIVVRAYLSENVPKGFIGKSDKHVFRRFVPLFSMRIHTMLILKNNER
jgi:hypothetical protein